MASILVVRKFDNFSRILAEHGFAVINCPTIETARKEDLRDFETKISAGRFDGIFLTSRAATEIFRQTLWEKNINFRGRVFVLGKSSFDLLKGENLDLFFDENANTAREMLEKLSPQELRNKRFLFVRGENSLRVVPDFLSGIAAVDEAVVYQTRKVLADEKTIKEIRAKAAGGEILGACFFSPSGAGNFLRQFGNEILRQTKIAAIGKTTADFLEKQNLKVDFVARKATAEDFAVELVDYLKSFESKADIL